MMNCLDLLNVGVTTIIQHNFDVANRVKEPRPKIGIRLISDKYLKSKIPPFFCGRVEIDADDSRLRAEVLPPHKQGAAVQHSNFHKNDISSHKIFEQVFVALE